MSTTTTRSAPRPPSAPPITSNSGIGVMGDLLGGIGVVHGDVYQAPADAPPAEKLRQAVNSLRRHDRSQALRLVGEAIDHGHETSEACYYLALAVLSGRSAEELTSQERQQVRHALGRLAQVPPAPGDEGFLAAGRFMSRLLPAALSADPDAGAAALLEELTLLPVERGTEVRSHLLRLLAVLRRDAVDADEDAETQYRTADGRAQRVPLYFTPDPAEPRAPDSELSYLFGAAGADLAAAAVAFVIGLALTLAAENFAALLGVVMLAGGGLLIGQGLTSGVEEERAARAHRWLAEATRGLPVAAAGAVAGRLTRMFGTAGRVDPAATSPPGDPALLSGDGAARRKFFLRTIAALVQGHVEHQPHADWRAAEAWRRISEQHQSALIAELTHLHAHDTAPGALDWLVRRRVRETAERWRQGTLRPLGPAAGERRNWARTWGTRLMIGSALLAVLLLSSLNATLQGLLVCALWLGAAVVTRRAISSFGRERLHEEDRSRHAADQVAFEQERQRLLARPQDEAMARWLDLDQRYLLREMLGEHKVQRRDILFTFFILEGARNCVRAKQANGPTRYSRYALKLFVLTTGGVWISTWEMNFATGQHGGRRDMVFRFDAINSVVLETIGVRFAKSRRELVATAAADGAPPAVADYDEPVIHEALRLVLNTGEHVDMLIENYDQLRVPGLDDPERLRAMALENTGVLSGFRILAALATEGPQWLVERRELALQELAFD